MTAKIHDRGRTTPCAFHPVGLPWRSETSTTPQISSAILLFARLRFPRDHRAQTPACIEGTFLRDPGRAFILPDHEFHRRAAAVHAGMNQCAAMAACQRGDEGLAIQRVVGGDGSRTSGVQTCGSTGASIASNCILHLGRASIRRGSGCCHRRWATPRAALVRLTTSFTAIECRPQVDTPDGWLRRSAARPPSTATGGRDDPQHGNPWTPALPSQKEPLSRSQHAADHPGRQGLEPKKHQAPEISIDSIAGTADLSRRPARSVKRRTTT